MYDFKFGLGSDNHSGIHPKLLTQIEKLNQAHAPSYGTDQVSVECTQEFKNLLGDDISVHFVFNGTAANVTCLAALTESYNSVLCADISHLNIDECGAPEFHTGCKLVPVTTVNGKLTPENIEKHLFRWGDQHFSQPKVISITQPTEVGTCYTLKEIKAISEIAKKNNMYLHMDGARLANAVHFLGCDFKQMIPEMGVDALSFGGTKNGLLFGEAVVLFQPSRFKDVKYIRKQYLNLPSKMRFLSGQFHAYLASELYKEVSAQSHKMAKYLEEKLADIPEIQVVYPVESNGVFVKIPKQWTKELKKNMFFYVWDEEEWVMRWMTSFDTQKDQIDAFIKTLNDLRIAE